MKRMGRIFFVILLFSSCSVSRETVLMKDQARQEARLEEQVMIRQAVESGHFMIKLNRIYITYGGFVDLVPRNNYIIIDGNIARISTAYIGRQYSYRPISGINMQGETLHYKLTGDKSKGRYDVEMRVSQGGDSFDLYLTVSDNGSCSVSLSNAMISSVRYTGQIYPLIKKVENPVQPDQNII